MSAAKDRLLDQLQEVLEQFDDELTTVSVHLTFTTVGHGHYNIKEELWWDENLMMFVPEEPE